MKQLHLIVTILSGLLLGAQSFNYRDRKDWGKNFPVCSDGQHQSPIQMVPDSKGEFPMYGTGGQIFDFNLLPDEIIMTNNGYTVELKPKWSEDTPRVTGGPLKGTYVFEKTTFHWSKYKGNGSEHTLYNEKTKKNFEYDMEMQMYFYKQEYKTFTKARNQKGGLAVFVNWLRLHEFWKINLAMGYPSNIRPPQALNGREIKTVQFTAKGHY
ncbi:carbonic anhydrase 1-like [Belonocnema kinseyi]|uniref:carbonic anhydrase 1-like n=1 Tax=Belonocnema kinseyi TaxID=2817044 RepID=UPI00143D4873|nr:carbonic anhydrase 1-like [Belonocnema kinseyi]